MKQSGDYMLGTVMEVAEAISKNVIGWNGKLTHKTRRYFKNCDFRVFDIGKERIIDLQTAFNESDSPLFGIKRLNLHFCNVNLELFANAYCWGKGQYECIELETSIDECVAIIAKMILCEIYKDRANKSYDENTIIIAQWVKD